MINWKMRIRSRRFWLTFIPAVLLLVQAAAALFGLRLELGFLSEKLLAIVNAVFMLLASLGIQDAGRKQPPAPTAAENAGREEADG